MERGAAIKDTVHGYIQLDPVERKIVDSPWFQRLRHIKQNDVTSVVYPTAQTSRFEHSLGAMHLSRASMRAALDGSGSVTQDYLEAMLQERELCEHAEALRAWSPAELAVRLASLCGLLHDLGHPPLSHLMEQCVSHKAIYGQSGSSKWHEENGVRIIRDHLSQVALEPDERALLSISADILSEREEIGPAMAAVHSLVDAVVDTDRMDFVLRDGRSSGSDFGHYDVDRIVRSFRLLLDRQGGSEIKKVYIRPSDGALSAIESLLQERYKIYRWVHFHPRVMLSKAYVRYALAEIQAGRAPDTRFRPELFRADQYCPAQSEKGRPFLFLDDRYAWTTLERALLRLEDLKTPDAPQSRLLKVLRGLLLRERWAVPLWKRLDDFREFGDQLAIELGNVSAPPDLTRLRCPGNLLADYALRTNDISALDALRAALNEGATTDWYLVEVTQGFSLKKADRVLTDRVSEIRRARNLTELSTVCRGVEDAWTGEIHFYVFLVSGSQPWNDRRDGLPGVLAEARADVTRRIRRLYETDKVLRRALDAFLDESRI